MEANRRDFIKKTALGLVASVMIPEIVSAAYEPAKAGKISLKKDCIILFQGDSITDAGRDKTILKSPNNVKALGTGYALLAASDLLLNHAEKNLKIHNKGISGHKVPDLAKRWDADCLEIKPDVLSIMIGVNDFWHTLNPTNPYKGTIKMYQDGFKALLDRTMQSLPDVKLIICEPFAVSGIRAVDEKWFPAFYDYQKTSKELADSFDAVFIPFQSVFDKAQKTASGVYWTGDGVHPTLPGARLMATAWMKAIKE